MKTIKFLLIISGLLLAFTGCYAQNTTSDKIIKTGNDLKKIFGKKEKPQTTSGREADGEKNKNASTQSNTNTSELKPGDVHPNAVYLDVDMMYHFNRGAAVVRKGSATALIDATGAFVIPYNKYRFTSSWDDKPTDQNNGIFPAWEGESYKQVFLSAKGKIIYEKTDHAVTVRGKYVEVQYDSYKSQFYTENGKPFTITKTFSGMVYNISEDLVLVSENSKYGFKNLKDEYVIKPIYYYASPFSEGLSCVGVRDEFGQPHFGFINKKGEVVIPLTYSNPPSDFSNGLAKVVPKDKSEFEFAFINQKNEIVIKNNKEAKQGLFLYFANGISCNSRYVMDITGKVVAAKDFIGVADNVLLQRAPLQYSHGNYFEGIAQFTALYDNGKIIFTNSTMSARDSRAGFYNIFKKTIVPPTFSLKNIPLVFDPVSGLAYANYYVGADAQNKAVYREGYINEQGIFMIVKGPSSKW